jgi:hypothetical protein
MKYMRRTEEYTWTDHKTNTEIAKELNFLDNIQNYKIKWIQYVNRMPHNRLPRLINYYTPKVRTKQGRPLKRLLEG